MNGMPLLKAENLSVEIFGRKKYFNAVDDVGFELYPGEVCGIVGESGCGKSLTALSIAGLLPAAARAKGSVLFSLTGSQAPVNLLGLDEKELCSIRGREISMIFQEPLSSLNPLKKISRQITEVPEIHGMGGKEENRQKAMHLLEKLGLENPARVMETYPFRLSGGMCQRVMIALAMICNPRLLIADEPTTALDADTQDQIIRLLKEISREAGTAILFISHDLGVIKQICSRVIVMYAGKMVEEGSTDEILEKPAHEYTRSLLGALPERSKKGEKLKVIPGRVPAIEDGRSGGCPFAPRCEKVRDQCRSEFPGEIIINENHKSRCILGAP